jgi:transposase
MSEALWARIVGVLETVGSTPRANARALMDAGTDVAITDTAWDALPARYPAPSAGFLAVMRWKARGLFTQLVHALPARMDT